MEHHLILTVSGLLKGNCLAFSFLRLEEDDDDLEEEHVTKVR